MPTVNNEKVSQLNPLTPTSVAADDLFFIADISNHESKKITTSDLLVYIGLSASFIATHAAIADTASYILGSGVQGNVSSASFSLSTISSSVAQIAYNAFTASFALNTPSALIGSASWASSSLTASFVATASFVRNSQSASFLIFIPGNSNGTASYAPSASVSLFSTTASFSSVASTTTSSSFATKAISSDTSSYVQTSQNGVLSYGSALSNLNQFGAGATLNFPVDVNNFSASLLVHSSNSKFLININLMLGAANPGNGFTGGSLWRSSSLGDGALLRCIGGPVVSEAYNLDTLYCLSATYIDTPNLSPGDTVIYRGRVFNNFGNYYINASGNASFLGTSSLSIIEFIS
jgi:hypothetical protein